MGGRARGAPFNTPQQESTMQACAAENGLAANVLYAAPEAFLTEYVHGDAWRPRHFEQSAYLKLLATMLRKVHALPTTGRVFAALSAARLYADRAVAADGELTGFCLDVVEKSGLPQDLRCCHNDVVAANLLWSPELMLIDWEYACDNDPFFDLATVVEHHDLSEQQVSVLMCAYTGADERHWREPLAEQRKLYLALWWLWLSQGEESRREDVAHVAERLLTSCSGVRAT